MEKICINSILDESFSNVKIVKINKQNIKVKTAITTADLFDIVNIMSKASFNKNGDYDSVFEIVAKKYAVVKCLTNINVEELTSNKLYDLTNQSWFDKVMEVVEGTEYWNDVLYAVDRAIDNMRKNSFDKLCDKISKFSDEVSQTTLADTMTNLSDIANKIQGATDKEVVNAILAKNKE